MRLWQWEGKEGDLAFGYDQLAGTGQSGSSATSTTRNHSFTNAKGLKITEQTSSGDGEVMIRMFLPWFGNFDKLKMGMSYLLPTADASVDYVGCGLVMNNDTKTDAAIVRVMSGYGLVNEVQYFNTSSGYTDTGVNFVMGANSGTVCWKQLEFALDRSTGKYLWVSLGPDTVKQTADFYSAGVSVSQSMEFTLRLGAKDTLATVYIDSVWLDAIT